MQTTGLSNHVQAYWTERHSVAGMFLDVDLMFFDVLLSDQDDRVSGDILEVGAFLGKSAVVLGAHQRGDEKVWICDVFGDPTDEDIANAVENAESYPGLARQDFEANYRRFVPREPVIIQALSSTLPDHVSDDSVRFAHIDGGHLYETVREDLQHALAYLAKEGVVALDDFRSVHTPGVAAAAWERIAQGDLFPIATTDMKLYAAPDEGVADRAVELLKSWVATQPDVHHGVQQIRGREVLIATDPGYKTRRQKVRALLPPALVELIRPTAPPHLGL